MQTTPHTNELLTLWSFPTIRKNAIQIIHGKRHHRRTWIDKGPPKSFPCLPILKCWRQKMEALHQLAGKFQQTLTKYNYTPTFVSNETNKRGESIFNYFSNGEEGAVYFTDDANFFDALNAKFNASIIRVLKEKHGVTYESLSQKLLISPEASKRAV